jgi:23S rRNA pseudouridine1911/1915/1917 synthase
MPEHSYIVSEGQQGSRLDAFLADCADVTSRAQAVRMIEKRQVSVNSHTVTSKRRVLLKDDQVVYNWQIEQPLALIAQDIPLDIRYEDEYLLVISKDAGIVVHPSHGHMQGTMVNALIAHCGYGNLAQLQGEDRPGVVHRLDMDTSGLMIMAKDDNAGFALQQAIRLREVDRRYLTLVHGSIAADTGLIDAPIGRSEKERQCFEVTDRLRAKAAVTSFNVLKRYYNDATDDGYTLLECKLFSGRTHQIRVHMSYTGHPVVGDQVYGANKRRRPHSDLDLERQFLHSGILEFVHPISGETLHFEDPLKAELLEALASLSDRDSSLTTRGKELQSLFERDIRDTDHVLP